MTILNDVDMPVDQSTCAQEAETSVLAMDDQMPHSIPGD